MAYLSKQEVKQIIDNRPADVTPSQVISGLISRGHSLEGFEQTAKQQETQQPKRSLTEKVGGFLGMEAFGKGIGLAVRELTGGNQTLYDAANREAALNASVPAATIARLKAEGKPLPGQTGTELSPQLQNITTEDLTNKQILGSAASTALLATGGSLSGGIERGVAGVLPEATSAVGRVATNLAPKIVSGAVTGAAFSSANATAHNASNQDIIRAGETGALVGGAVPVAVEVAKPILRTTGKVIAGLFGHTTATSGGAVERAFTSGGNEGFREGLRGHVTGQDILLDAKQGLNAIKLNRAATYQKQLADISQSGTTVDLQPVQEKLPSILENFGVKETTDGFNFSRSSISNSSGIATVRNVLNDVKTWDDFSPIGVDRLKQRISDSISEVKPSSKSGALLSQLNNEITSTLNSQVPGYQEMTAGYAVVSDQIKQIQNTLSLKDGISQETAIKKLLPVLKANNEFREQLVAGMPGGQELLDKIAGFALHRVLPGGLTQYAEAGGLTLGLSKLSPNLLHSLSLILAFSPRVVGEAARYAGMATQAVAPVVGSVAQQATPALIGGSVGQSTQPQFADFNK